MRSSQSILRTAGICLLAILLISQCGTNRLHEITFHQATVAAVMAAPPRAKVFTDAFWHGGDNIISTAIRIGTTIAKTIKASEAQAKLDAAMTQVDIPERIRERALRQSGKYMRFKPVDDTETADFVYIMKIKKYGIEAQSWDARVEFLIDLNIRLIDQERNRKVWERSMDERLLITGRIFGLGETAGDVITAATLSSLTEEQMREGFIQLSDLAADRIAERMHEDYLDAHDR